MVFGQPLLSNCSMSVFRKYSKVTWTVLRLFDRPALLFWFHKTAAWAIWVWPVQSQWMSMSRMAAIRVKACKGGTVIPCRQYCTSFSLTLSRFAAFAELMPALWRARSRRAPIARRRALSSWLRSRCPIG